MPEDVLLGNFKSCHTDNHSLESQRHSSDIKHQWKLDLDMRAEMGRRTSLERGRAIEKLSGWDKKVEGGSNDSFCPQGLRRGGWGKT